LWWLEWGLDELWRTEFEGEKRKKQKRKKQKGKTIS
jgi:hypothetical protein